MFLKLEIVYCAPLIEPLPTIYGCVTLDHGDRRPQALVANKATVYAES